MSSKSSIAGRNIRCILFDLGETLWTRVDQETWHAVERHANQRAVSTLYTYVAPDLCPISDISLLEKQLRQSVEAETRQLFQRTSREQEPDYIQATRKALLGLGIPPIDQEGYAAIFEALRIRIPESRILFDDVLTTLAELRQRGFLLGVVTNRQHGGRLFLEDLQTLGLLDYFSSEHIAISADLSIRKPHPDIFLNPLKALDVAPSEAAMVGDNLHADVDGAQKLNIFGIWKPKSSLRAAALAALKDLKVTTQDTLGISKRLTHQYNGEQQTSVSISDTDADNYLLDYIYRHDIRYYQYTYDRPQPDLIIEHLSDLLTVFTKAGRQ